jgi:hypothetical protein
MRGRTTGVLIVSFTLLSIFLLLGSLTSASSPLSRIEVTTTTTTSFGTATSSSATSGLHELTFIQETSSDCNGTEYWVPWSVTLSNGAVGNLTESNPANATMMFSDKFSCPNGELTYAPGHGLTWSNNESVSTITFLVPYGSYSYEIVGPVVPAAFGQTHFSPSNAFPVEINLQ